MKTLLLICMLAGTGVAAMVPHSAQAADVVVVDDDKAQCPHARFRSIQAAVDKARADAVIKVCAGRYAEQVTVDKPLEIEGNGASVMKVTPLVGDQESIDATDCFSPARPTLDPNTQVIVAPPLDAPTDVPTVLFDLRADRIKIEGLILLGNENAALPSSRAAVQTSAAHSGYQIHHNFFVANTVAAFLNSNGEHPSVFSHNCLRENGWGVANNFERLIDARVHDNSTFRTRNFAYEQTQCPASNATCVSRIGMDRVTFEHNVSKEDHTGFRLAFSTSTTVSENTVTSPQPCTGGALTCGIGIRLAGGNQDLDIVGNQLHVRFGGIVSGSNLPANRAVLIEANTITGTATSAGIGMGDGALKDSWILGNTITGIDGEGIALGFVVSPAIPANTVTNNLVRGNVVLNGGRNGIAANAGAIDNTFELNQMHGNGAFDAREDVPGSNTWNANDCDRDNVGGAICGAE